MPKVLFIVGKGRSGTTLVDELLGQVDGFVSTGELRYLWQWGLVDGYPCSCGRHVTKCPLWSGVLARLGAGPERAADLARLTAQALAWARIPWSLTVPRQRNRSTVIDRYSDLMGELYAAIADETGARVIVDSTKWPAHPGLFGHVDGVDPYGLHITRDPRAVANSYKRGKSTAEDHPDMPRYGAFHSATSWAARNLMVELARGPLDRGRVKHVRYEDLVRAPDRWLDDIVTQMGETYDRSPFLDGHRVRISGNHLVGGNPDRFHRSTVEVRPDERWRAEIRSSDALLVTVLTAPLLRRYGYGWSFRQSRPPT